MKHYLSYFEFVSGLFESYFYKDVRADDVKDAITQLVSFFLDIAEEQAADHLHDKLGTKWSTEDFWAKIDTNFFNDSMI